MKRRVIITPAAEQDIADAIDWYEASHPGLSFDFRLALDATLNLIVRHPGVYALVAKGMRRALMSRFPHSVFYRDQTDIIQIVAILHPRRHPRIWQARDH